MGSKNKNRTKIIGAAAAAGAALGYAAVCNQLFDFTVARKEKEGWEGQSRAAGSVRADSGTGPRVAEEPGTGRIGDLFHRGRHLAVRALSSMRES